MFYTIELREYLMEIHFTSGPGFYLVKYGGYNGIQDEIVYFNAPNKGWVFLCHVIEASTKLLECFDKEVVVPDILPTGTISMSEEFLLKLVAVSKVNSQTVKLNDILKTQ